MESIIIGYIGLYRGYLGIMEKKMETTMKSSLWALSLYRHIGLI